MRIAGGPESALEALGSVSENLRGQHSPELQHYRNSRPAGPRRKICHDMPLDVSAFANTRPFLYHLTAAENVHRIQATTALISAAQLFSQGGRSDLTATRRLG